MRRFFLACLVTLLAIPAAPGLNVAAQTPVATPDPFSLPINLLLLRVTEGNGFAYVTDRTGTLVYDNIHIISDGAMPDDLPPFLRDIYTEVGLRDMYYMYVALLPEDAPPGRAGRIGITIEMRLITVADSAAAARLVERYPDLLRPPLAPGEPPADISVIANPPAHDEAIVGVTGLDPYFHVESGEPAGIEVPYARFIAQHGTIVASAKVTSLDPAFNDAVARELLAEQLACLAADAFCVPVPLPANVEYVPGTPIASPVARRR